MRLQEAQGFVQAVLSATSPDLPLLRVQGVVKQDITAREEVQVQHNFRSALPTPVTPGYYTVSNQAMAKGSLAVDALTAERDKERITRVSQRRCEPGHYCVNGERYACPAGTFGNTNGLTTPECSSVCAAGYYCPQGSIVAQAVACATSAVFCPQGSAQPTTTDRGYCAISEGTVAGARWYGQRKAKPGEFAWRGSCYPCPAGRYGSEEMETRPTCSGPCDAGYYCPPGSTSPTQHECGSASVYCPAASVRPWAVLEGYYTSLQVLTLPPNATEAPGCEPGKYRDYSTTVSAFVDVITGRSPVTVNYGDYSFPVAECVACPDGTFKPGTGDNLEFCQPCPEYTTISTSDRRSCSCFRLAGGTTFDGSTFALHFEKATLTCELVPKALVAAIGDGNASNNSVYTRSEQFPCERGYYCRDGVRSPCPAGYYGDGNLETRSTCSGVCSSGFYCPLASWNSTARVCGDANVFCPSGSAVPLPVWSGYYSVRLLPFGADRLLVANAGSEKYSVSSTGEEAPKNEAIRDGQRICEPGTYCIDGKKYLCPVGRYGDQSGETSPLCAGLCSRGYRCPEGSSSSTQLECGGSNFVCGSGSPAPQLVHPGYYSIGPTATTRFFQQPCELGSFCIDGVKYPCPAGTFGATSGLSTAACSGKCAPGYYCPPSSISRTQNECGSSSVYCPEGTGKEPRFVSSGYYSVLTSGMVDDGRNATQNDMKICPKGFYCRQGIRIRCPEGTYGDIEGLSAATCSGWCPEGYFCPFATTDYRLNPCLPGTYSTKGATFCIQCPTSSTSRAAVLKTFQLLSKEETDKHPCTTHRECCFLG
ncbi:Hypothetical protein PHPALM_4382 [Phytophthora palmivora]|uniref:Uncharacterized protein n=1 Tax=Phytophthora palmivora TaxID=4796 RepID=A0A2P4YK08_9STRA|nr:Hypothetical protein PHPALM_4382 [Phytophthora palmivora]